MLVLVQAAPADVVNTLTGQGVTLNLHHYSVSVLAGGDKHA